MEEVLGAGAILAALVAITGYFFKKAHSNLEDSIKELSTEMSELDTRQTRTEERVANLQSDLTKSVLHLEKSVDLKIKNVTDKLDIILEEIRKRD